MDSLLTAGQIRRLFPELTDCKDLVGTDMVDYLISIQKASWHPKRFTKLGEVETSGCMKIDLGAA